ncbi:MAG: hybrid sensor histidine kinase/response regulator [Myxococcales bacterium]|jgi:two-component system NtrC family sensor kinase
MQTSPRRVLIVDDERLVRRALVRTVSRQGWQAVEAEGGEQGLALLAQQRFQVVLSDYLMPKMNGIDFLAQAKERWPRVQRILLTAHAEQQALMDAINRCEVFRFLTKPWDESHLHATLASAFERYETREEELRRLRLLPERGEALELTAGEQESLASSAARCEQAADGRELALSSAGRSMSTPGAGSGARCAGFAEGASGREAAPGEGEAEECGDRPALDSDARLSGCPIIEERAHTASLAGDAERSGAMHALVGEAGGQRPLALQEIRAAKLAAVERAADLVVHEANNALGTILVLTQMMRREESRSAEDLECLQDVEEAAARCESLVSGLGRLGAGSRGDVAFELRDAIEDALLVHRLRFKYQSKFRFEAQLTGEPLRICGDRSLVQLALGVMLEQATARALEAGGQSVQVRSSRQGESAEVVVLDGGSPLSVEESGWLVEPGSAGQGSDPAGQGALAVSSAIALRHGGCLEAGKREGGGDAYILRFPLVG